MEAALIFLIGLGIGSFLNVVIFRFPRGENFVGGRSRCPSCGHILRWTNLFPLASFLLLRGKCRFCSKKISWRYFSVELLTAAVFLVFFWIIRPDNLLSFWLFSVWLAISCLLIVLIFIDFDYFIIPDKILIAIGLLVLLENIFAGSQVGIFNNFITAIVSGVVFLLIFLATKAKKMGLGDVKLMALLGFTFGFPGILPVFYLAVASALVWSIILILFFGGKLQTKLPFGSLLGGSAITFILFNKFLMPILAPYIFKLYT